MKIFQTLLCFLSVFIFPTYAQKIRFTPQWSPQSQFAGYYAALENGYYAELGLEVEIVHPSTSYSSISMLKDGTSDLITCELIQAVDVTDDGMRLINLLQTTQHSTLALISRLNDIGSMATWLVYENNLRESTMLAQYKSTAELKQATLFVRIE